MNSLLKEISYTIRGLARRPVPNAIAVATLALGIGLVTIQFSFVNAVMIKGLPFERSDRIMNIERIDAKGNTRSIPLTDFSAWRERQTSFEEFAALDSRETLQIGGDGLDARTYRAAAFSAGVLKLLGVQPLLGRGFSAEDERVDAAPVVLLSYPVWKDSFGGDPNIAGRTIRLSGKPATILGVMPEGFAFPSNHQAWINLRPVSPGSPEGPGLRARADFIGRLNNDTTLAAARAEFSLLNTQSESTSAVSTESARVQIVPYIDSMRETDFNILLLSMLVVVGGVLVVACLNVANLLSAHALQRGHELAIRSALGASRARLVRQMLTESGVLALTGALGGLLLASWIVPLLNRLLADHPERPFWMVIDIDYLVLTITAGVTLGVGLLAGLFPALRSTRHGTIEVLKDAAVSGPGLRVGRLNRGLVVTQVALSCAVLISTGVLVDGMRKSTKIELPFNANLILSAEVRPDSLDFKTTAQRLGFYTGLLERVRALPGVKNATITQSYPFNRMGRSSVEVSGAAMTTEVEAPRVFVNRVASGFFRDLQLPLREGREFDDRDGPYSERVAIVSESFARRFWPGESALGKRVRKKANASAASADGWMTVIGVAQDLPIGTPDKRQGLHVPLSQDPFSAITLLLTATQDPKPLSRSLRDAVRSLSPDVAVDLVQTLDERGNEDRRLSRMLGALTFVFGVSALLLAAVGVYGVTSFTVQRRTREFGVRMALGARPADVLGLVFRQGARQLMIGLFAGTFGGWVISRPLMGVMAGMAEPAGLIVYVSVFGCVTISMVYALWWPARRAAKVDPLVALRYE